jgi:hypothetical protein
MSIIAQSPVRFPDNFNAKSAHHVTLSPARAKGLHKTRADGLESCEVFNYMLFHELPTHLRITGGSTHIPCAGWPASGSNFNANFTGTAVE